MKSIQELSTPALLVDSAHPNILYIMSITQVASRGGIVVQVTVSIHRVWARSLKQATLRIMSRGRSRSMYPGRVYGECVTRTLLVG